MNLQKVLLSASLGFAFAGLALPAFAAPKSSTVVVSSKSAYASGSAEASEVLKWISTHAPEYSPILTGVTVEVAHKSSLKTSNSGGRIVAASPPPPPVAPPLNGQPGDEFTVTIRDRAGNTETWGFTYVGGGMGNGGWVCVEYHYKNVDFENQDSPETLGG
ncbi:MULTISPECIES: hypothetical protein [Stenotrophomonas]|uniref:hypothetical protein n=1 Tax=Stenotrophomonas TaxID=40323 RepID=UPI001D6442C0|nr:hypothetical protein [Stenotrophomonas lactitubi]CAH0184092.1 hypothetical protein SRABI35_01315 [Stenotrophomonas lactitubi]HED4875618.1 hypothetical protein [Stenotrophomonas maltophilia]